MSHNTDDNVAGKWESRRLIDCGLASVSECTVVSHRRFSNRCFAIYVTAAVRRVLLAAMFRHSQVA